MKKIVNRFLSELFNIVVVPVFPRHFVRFAKKYYKNNPVSGIEIGTFEGANANSILKELNIKKIYLIDPYIEYEDYIKSEKVQTQKCLSIAERNARKRLKKNFNKVIWVRKFSDDAIKDTPNVVDFIYIDGNHEYEYVIKDMENYWPKIKKGGILAGHDITNFTGVAKAFVEFCYKKKLKPYISRTDWWVIKRR